MQDLPNLDSLQTKTRLVLLKLIQTAPFLQHFVLVGGSALALHICHRQSEDLDFFTYQDVFNTTIILDCIKCFPQREIINNSPQQLDLLLNGVKVTFINEARASAATFPNNIWEREKCRANWLQLGLKVLCTKKRCQLVGL